MFQPTASNSCLETSVSSLNITNITILKVTGANYCFINFGITKNEVIYILLNSESI